MANAKNTEFVTKLGNMRTPVVTKPEPFKSQPLGYKLPDGTFVQTGGSKPDQK